MSNILFYIPKINRGVGGVFQYSYSLLSSLAKSNNVIFIYNINEEADIFELVDKHENLHLISKKQRKEPLFLRVKRKILRGINKILIRTPFKYKINVPYNIETIDYLIKKLKIDIIHCPYQDIQTSSWGTPSITTMHDVQELHFPEFFTSKQRAYRAVNYKKAIDGANAVIVSYNHVKEDIIKYFDKPVNQIYTVLLDMKELWISKISNRNSKILDKCNLPSSFLLYPASSWEHKNHLNLIKAIKELNNSEIHLVCTGHPTDHYKSKIEPYIKEKGLIDRIKFVGIVSDEELFELYHTCKAVVVPTLYEAGSFPLMESILMQIPVVCSNVTSLPETIGDNRFVFDPLNISDIADKINKIYFDDVFRKENKSLLKMQALKFINNNVAYKIDKIYAEILIAPVVQIKRSQA